MSKHFKDNLVETVFHLLAEGHYKGKTVIVAGKKGIVGKQVGKDGDTENDEIYKVRFEDGTVKDIPVRDMEIQQDSTKNTGENEMEDLVKENEQVRQAKMRNVRKDHGKAFPEILKDKDKDNEKDIKEEEKKVKVKTTSGTTDKVSQDDLESAANMYDVLRGKKKVNEASVMSAARGIGTSALGGVSPRLDRTRAFRSGSGMNTSTRKPMSQSALDTARNLTNQRKSIENRTSVQQGYRRVKAQQGMNNKPVGNKPAGKTPAGRNTTTGKPMSSSDLSNARSVTNQRQSLERGLKVTKDRQALERKLRAPEYEKQDRRSLRSGKITQRQYDNRQLSYAGKQSQIPKPTPAQLKTARDKIASTPEARASKARGERHDRKMEMLDRKAAGKGYTRSPERRAADLAAAKASKAKTDKVIADYDRRAKTNTGPAYMSRRDRNNLMNRNMQMGRNPYDDRMFYSRNEEVLNEVAPLIPAAIKAGMMAWTAYDAYKLAKGLMDKKSSAAGANKSSNLGLLKPKQPESDIDVKKKKKKKIVTPAGKVSESVELNEEQINEILGAVSRLASRIAPAAGRTARAAARSVPGARYAGVPGAKFKHGRKKVKKAKKKAEKDAKRKAMTPTERMLQTGMRYYLYPQIAGDVARGVGSAASSVNPINWGQGRRSSSQNVYGG